MNIFYFDNNNKKDNYQESIQRIVDQRNNLFKEIENNINTQLGTGNNETIKKSIELIIQIEEKIKRIKELNSLQSNILEYINPTTSIVPTSPFSSPIIGSCNLEFVEQLQPLSHPSIKQSSKNQTLYAKQQLLTTKKKLLSSSSFSFEKHNYQREEYEEKEKEKEENEQKEKDAEVIKSNKPKRGRPLKPKPEYCFRCGTRSCPYWRKNVIKGEVVDVCNACGLHLMKKEKKDLVEKQKNSILNLLNNDETLTNYDDPRFVLFN
ncbi:hypothetical protein ACTFIU_000227 [Dictyostelium citrinum]